MSMLDAIGEVKQIQIVRSYPDKIFSIPNPTEQVKLIAVKHNGLWLERLLPASKRVELAAVKQNGMAIRFVRNPTKEMKVEAVKQNGMSLQFIRGASFALKKLALQQTGLAIQFIRAPNDELWDIALENDGLSIQFHPNPSEHDMLEAVTSMNPDVILHIKNPSEMVWRRAVECSGAAIKHLPADKQTRELQRLAVKAKASSIEFISEPAEEVQVMAVKSNVRLIHRIYRPKAAAVSYARAKGIDV